MYAPRSDDFPLYIRIAKARAAARSGERRAHPERLLLDQFGRVINERIQPLVEEVSRLRTQNGSDAAIPAQRKYDVEEVRLRLYTGRDPLTLSASERSDAELNALSVRTIERLVAAGDLERLIIGGSRFFSEEQVQAYERRLGEGRATSRAPRRGGKRRE